MDGAQQEMLSNQDSKRDTLDSAEEVKNMNMSRIRQSQICRVCG